MLPPGERKACQCRRRAMPWRAGPCQSSAGPRQSVPRRPHAGARSREQEDVLIKQLVNVHGQRDWAKIAAQLPGRECRSFCTRRRPGTKLAIDGTLPAGPAADLLTRANGTCEANIPHCTTCHTFKTRMRISFLGGSKARGPRPG